jgi:phosphoserine phosphatase RsbU/P
MPARRLWERPARSRPAPDDEAHLTRPTGMRPPPGRFGALRTLPGRLFVLSGLLLAGLLGLERLVQLPLFLEILRKVVSLAFFVAAAWLAVLLIGRNWRLFLWRVRRKLILSYVFLGFVPVVLVVAFALAGGVVFYTNVAAYMFHEGFDDVVDNVQQIAETSAIEIGRNPDAILPALQRKYANLATQYPALSLAVVPAAAGTAGPVVSAGAWHHLPPPATLPAWVTISHGFKGVLALASPDPPAEERLLIRAVAPTPAGDRMVVADLPVDTDLITRLHDRTGTRMGAITVSETGGAQPLVAAGPTLPAGADQAGVPRGGALSLFRQTVAFMDFTDWQSGRAGRVSISLYAPLGRLYERLAAAQSAQLATALGGTWDGFLRALLLLGVLFLIIQGSALVMGAVLARSITSAVHELFTGTERIRQGDFTHRIAIESQDQLGDLADSFNRMSASIEHLLHVQREKQRLDDELRIAREIQKSLLPVQTPQLEGLAVADLCEPAREVGGDYYDFFEIGPRQLGVLIADVSGKGTSAALYMAELKGLMLALSHNELSPRRLLVDLNRRLAGHLDNRSFITMTYLVLDLEAGTLTFARAGHTPLIVVQNGRSEVLVPDGMVLGLRLPGAGERFEQMLCEYTQRIGPGDVVVLYTDGITEAMDRDGELFGDAALARVLAGNHLMDAAGIRERVLRDVKAFVGDAEQHDDMTMVVLKLADRRGA